MTVESSEKVNPPFQLENAQCSLHFKFWNQTLVPSSGSDVYGDPRIWPEFVFYLAEKDKKKILEVFTQILKDTGYVNSGSYPILNFIPIAKNANILNPIEVVESINSDTHHTETHREG